jgi:hypothetical protein
MACVKSFDASAKNFMWVVYRVGKKCVVNEGGFMEK